MNAGDEIDEDGVPVDALTAHLEAVTAASRAVGVAQAEQMAAVYRTMLAATRNPDVYVPEWSARSRAKQVEHARRAAIFDMVLRLSIPEGTVWSMYHDADTLINRLPALWSRFRDGSVVLQNVRIAAKTARDLPSDDPRVFDELDTKLVNRASVLTPSKFATAARAIRERLHPNDPVVRHREARADRRVIIDADQDGMGWVTLYTDAATVGKPMPA